MNTSLISRLLFAVGVCLGFAQAAAAQDSMAVESVWIFSDRYIFSEHGVLDPKPTNSDIQQTEPQIVRLDVCEPFAPRLLLAAYRFRDFHLEIRSLSTEDSVCAVETAAHAVIAVKSAQKMSPSEDAIVDRYWRGLMP